MKHIRHHKGPLAWKKISIVVNEQGLTLLEVLVAFLILSIVLVSMLDMFALTGRQNSDTYRYNEALSLAQSKIEEIKKTQYKRVAGVASTSFISEGDYAQFQGLNYTVTVVDSGLNTKTVTVTVSYSDEGVPKQLDLTAEVARR